MSYKPTKEEIALCKKIAEKHRKEIVYGDWYADFVRVMNQEIGEGELTVIIDLCTNKLGKPIGGIPLWQISDCLEFLEEKGFTYTINFITPARGYELILFENHQKRPRIFVGETKKIVCQKAVFGILKEE